MSEMTVRTIGVAIVVIVAVVLVYTEIQKRVLFAKLERLFASGELEAYLKVLDRPSARLAFPRYNLLYMRLNALIVLERKSEAMATIAQMLNLRMSPDQRKALYARAFNYFVELGQTEQAEELFAKIEALGDEDMTEACRMTLDVFCRGSYDYIDAAESALASAKGPERVSLCHLLSVQCENKGDAARAKKYLDMAREELEKTGK